MWLVDFSNFGRGVGWGRWWCSDLLRKLWWMEMEGRGWGNVCSEGLVEGEVEGRVGWFYGREEEVVVVVEVEVVEVREVMGIGGGCKM